MLTQPPPTAVPPTGAPISSPPLVGRAPRRWRWPAVVGLLGLLGLLLVATWLLTRPAAAPVTPTAVPAGAASTARGRIEPVAHARIATLTGGTVLHLLVVAGEPVVAEQELARIRGTGGQVEVITAPWAGTIMAVPVNRGDTLLPGTVVASLGDLSRLQVETTDIDEFLIGRLRVGQPVSVTVDALDQRQLDGYVRSVTLEPQAIRGSDEHYPVVIELVEAPPELRPGMTVRLRLGP